MLHGTRIHWLVHDHSLSALCPTRPQRSKKQEDMVMKLMLKCLTKPSIHIGIFTFCNKSYVTNQLTGLNPNGSKLFQTTNSVPWIKKTVSNGSRIHCMKVWNPIDNKKFETLSYLPPLTDDSIAKEIEYMMKKGWIPCLEFDSVGYVFRENSRIPNYYDGRYWTMWKLPMFGCTDASQVLTEIQECKKAYPNAYIRCLAFDNVRQAQCMSFVIQKPSAP